MQVDTQRVTEQQTDYDFFTVKCSDCDEESGAILHKNFGDIEGNELIAYIKESSGYEVNHEAGGLRCKICDRKNRMLRRIEDGKKGDV